MDKAECERCDNIFDDAKPKEEVCGENEMDLRSRVGALEATLKELA